MKPVKEMIKGKEQRGQKNLLLGTGFFFLNLKIVFFLRIKGVWPLSALSLPPSLRGRACTYLLLNAKLKAEKKKRKGKRKGKKKKELHRVQG